MGVGVNWERTMMQPSSLKIYFEQCVFILGEKEKLMFENLQKKYSRKIFTLKKLQQCGTSRQSVEKAENDLNEYKFIFWINEFTSYRSTISNTLTKGSFPYSTSITVASSSTQYNEDIMRSPQSNRSFDEDQHGDIEEEEIFDLVSPSVSTDPTPVSKQDQKSLPGKDGKNRTKEEGNRIN